MYKYLTGRLAITCCMVVFVSAVATAANAVNVPHYPKIIDCSKSDDPLCKNGLPPGVQTYSMPEALAKRQSCVAGDLLSCYELCRRRLNGNASGYSCPTVLNATSFVGNILITPPGFGCDTLKNEENASNLDLKNDDDLALKIWMKAHAGACEFITRPIKGAIVKRTDDETYLIATAPYGRQIWTEGIFLSSPTGKTPWLSKQ